ncbi:MAG TPA: beta-eliminating lyase-related protein [Vicinamibacterales bacterium]|nr:beta-eliminating lyase-related protein [Vicinamibacterales bacterium]
MNRRRFLAAAGLPALAFGTVRADAMGAPAAADDRTVHLSGDGVGLNPAQYAALLNRLLEEKSITPDSYSLGGVVEELEERCARMLGKERAIFMPTGTLANHMAVRALAGGSSRVIVQEQSHFYQDEGDCAQTLSSLNLMPLAPGRASFTADEVQHVIDQTKGARVVSRVSVIAVETPVRRKQGEHVDGAELTRIIALARREGIRLHLDGARLFLQAAYTGESVVEYARPFDTVYVSLYKYFNAASGAILAGPRNVIDGMYHERRMFGGGLNAVWPFAMVALHYLDGFSDRYGRAVKLSEECIRGLQRDDRFAIERISSGTNLFRLRVHGNDAGAFQKRLAARGLLLPSPQGDAFLVGVNETLNRTTAPELTDAFVRALT